MNYTKERNKKVSDSLKKFYSLNPQVKKILSKKMKETMTGRKLSIEHKRKISKYNKGKVISIEQINRIKWHFKNNPNMGMKNKKQSEEIILKRVHNTDWKKQSENLKKYFKSHIIYNKGKTLEEIHGTEKAKILRYKSGNGKRGKPISLERKNSQSIKMKKYMKNGGSKNLKKYYIKYPMTDDTKYKISKKLKGEQSYLWRGGITNSPYDDNWNNIFKLRIKKRDNFECQLCNSRKKICIHHINYNKQMSIDKNCICLCSSCHTKTTTNRNYWILFFQNLLYNKFKYKYDNIKIENANL